MPTDYTGDPTATQAPSPPPGDAVEPVVRLPNDGEAANVASIWQELKAAADFIAWLTNHAAWRDIATSITAAWTFNNYIIADGAAGDTNPGLLNTATPTNFKYLFGFTGGTTKVRFYKHDTGLVITSNALWNGSEWIWDASGDSVYVSLTSAAFVINRHLTAGGSPWASANWQLAAQVSATGRSLSVVEDITTTTGDITADAGVFTGGAFIGNGSTPTAVPDNTGTGTGAASVSGTNASGTVNITQGPDPTAPGLLATVTFAGGGYPSAPRAIILFPGDGDAVGEVAAGNVIYVRIAGTTPTTFEVWADTALSGGSGVVYSFTYIVVG